MSKPTQHEIALAVLQLTNKYSQTKAAKATAQYLVHERRSSELDAIMREVQKVRREENGITEVNLTSAFPLSAQVKKELTKFIVSDSKVVANEIIDESVLGGVRMETSETQLDLTVRNRLQKLKEGVVR